MNAMSELDDLTKKLRGIKAPRGEGNGYNMPGGGKKLAARLKDAARKRAAKQTADDQEKAETLAYAKAMGAKE
jgi:hypothetical protein